MKISPIVAWYDMWIGAFWDTKKRRLYIFPVPCFGLVVDFGADQPPRPFRFGDLVRHPGACLNDFGFLDQAVVLARNGDSCVIQWWDDSGTATVKARDLVLWTQEDEDGAIAAAEAMFEGEEIETA